MAEVDDPQLAEALALAKSNPELGRWLEAQNTAQEALRAKFHQITPPAGLKEQIISEHAAGRRPVSASPARRYVVAALCLVLLVGAGAIFWFSRQEPMPDNTLASFQRDMVSQALRGYGMDLTTNDTASIRAFLTRKYAPANFTLPKPMEKAALAGCAVEAWQGAKVSLICFQTGKPLPPGTASDLWLFVVDRAAVKNPPNTSTPQFVKVSRLSTATWTSGDKLYLLGVAGDEQEIQKYL
jgi:hypothetical protein